MYNQSTPVHAHDAIIKLPLFQGMESDLLHGLIASSRAVEFDKGTVFLAQGQAITRFYIIMDGWCGASRGNVSGQEAILQIFQRGDFLPEADGTLQPDHSPLNLQTLTPVHLLMIAPNIVRNALEHSKAFASNMLAASIHRCNELRDHVEQLIWVSSQKLFHAPWAFSKSRDLLSRATICTFQIERHFVSIVIL